MIGDIAHICNRGIEKRNIFLDNQDYLRFAENLFLLNNKSGKIRTVKNIFSNIAKLPMHDKLVDVLKWCILPNHYHLLVQEKVDGGIVEFTKRVGNAYTKYFNTRRVGRSGYVFQNRAKIIPVVSDAHFMYIPFYIDLNPLDLKFPKRKTAISRNSVAFDFLKSYKWSSFKDYFGKGGEEIILNRDLFYDLFDTTPADYLLELENLSTCEVDKFLVD